MAVLGKVVITPKGEYSDHTSYDKLDCVYKDGSTWLAKQPTQSNPPPNDGSESNDYWQLLARGVPIDTKDSTVTFEEAEEDSELTSGSTHSVLIGLIKKKFADIFASLASKLSAANIANNLVTTEPGFALDARQGKALNDKINDVNNNLVGKLNKDWIWLGDIFTLNGTIDVQHYSSYSEFCIVLVYFDALEKRARTSIVLPREWFDGGNLCEINTYITDRCYAEIICDSTKFTLAVINGTYANGVTIYAR